jgi:hypothetical protein
VGCWRELLLLSPVFDAEDGVVIVLPGDAELWEAWALPDFAVWPWKAFAAAIEISPDSPTAPAIIQRLIREISASPASRALTARGFTRPSVGGASKASVSGA